MVFNKILTFPLDFHLTNFGARNMATVVVGKGGGGEPLIAMTIIL